MARKALKYSPGFGLYVGYNKLVPRLSEEERLQGAVFIFADEIG